MHASKVIRVAVAFAILVELFGPPRIDAQQKVMGELKFSGASKAEKDSGVWVDGQYVGYLRELKGDKKIVLLPGDHEIVVRQAGYQDFTKKVVVEPDQVQLIAVRMVKDPRAVYPGKDAAILKFDITPDRSAVFLDDGYVAILAVRTT